MPAHQEVINLKGYLRFHQLNSPYEFLIGCFVLFIGIGFTLFDTSFAKAGIPLSLPSVLGGLENASVKLFTFEIFFLFLFSAAFVSLAKWKEKFASVKPTSLHSIIFLILAFSIIRLLWDIRVNPILGIRNAAFC